jgi:hypothetical protein
VAYGVGRPPERSVGGAQRRSRVRRRRRLPLIRHAGDADASSAWNRKATFTLLQWQRCYEPSTATARPEGERKIDAPIPPHRRSTPSGGRPHGSPASAPIAWLLRPFAAGSRARSAMHLRLRADPLRFDLRDACDKKDRVPPFALMLKVPTAVGARLTGARLRAVRGP